MKDWIGVDNLSRNSWRAGILTQKLLKYISWLILSCFWLTFSYFIRFELTLPDLYWARIKWNLFFCFSSAFIFALLDLSWNSLLDWWRKWPALKTLKLVIELTSTERTWEALKLSIAYALPVIIAFSTGGRLIPRSVALMTWALHLISQVLLILIAQSFRAYHLEESTKREPERRATLIASSDLELEYLRKLLAIRGFSVVQALTSDQVMRSEGIGSLVGDTLILGLPPNQLKEILNKLSERGDINTKRIYIVNLREEDLILREPSFEDLIGRREIDFGDNSLKLVRKVLEGKRVLVTGCGGTIGSALLERLLELRAEGIALEILGVDTSEAGLFNLEMSLKDKGINLSEVDLKLLDLRDRVATSYILYNFKPDLIIHAAAYKHVPILEREPYQAILNDFLVTHWLVNLSDELEVELEKVVDFVFISTDKAVYPSSNLGLAKRWGEIAVLSSEGKGQRKAVRFGNVLGSSGSVLEVFKKRLEQGLKLPITSPEVERYFMSLKEASIFILLAYSLKDYGRAVAILDMGRRVRILDLAKRYLRLKGFNPEEMIEFIGLRPGEKLTEDLRYDFEIPLKVNEVTLIDYWEHLLTLREYLRRGVNIANRILEEPSSAEEVIMKLRKLLNELNETLRRHVLRG